MSGVSRGILAVRIKPPCVIDHCLTRHTVALPPLTPLFPSSFSIKIFPAAGAKVFLRKRTGPSTASTPTAATVGAAVLFTRPTYLRVSRLPTLQCLTGRPWKCGGAREFLVVLGWVVRQQKNNHKYDILFLFVSTSIPNVSIY